MINSNTDIYTDSMVVIDRLVKEWKGHDKIIIDYDFDNTVFDYHGEGIEFKRVINALRSAKSIGAVCYCFTSSPPSKYDFIESYLKESDIPCDGINVEKRVVMFGGLKPYFNILLDDRAGLGQALHVLESAITEMKIYLKNKEKQS